MCDPGLRNTHFSKTTLSHVHVCSVAYGGVLGASAPVGRFSTLKDCIARLLQQPQLARALTLKPFR